MGSDTTLHIPLKLISLVREDTPHIAVVQVTDHTKSLEELQHKQKNIAIWQHRSATPTSTTHFENGIRPVIVFRGLSIPHAPKLPRPLYQSTSV